ncbi:MAG: pyruvate/ketoisovalerate oxidoreductase, gamma subunit [Deltaproteobacteria bacterium]|jgi:2-oxoglutarate ferredoxin oxidoreductase subunit gamma|nr:pyruvate/ketoisovalerate oxidoreductase, gamma subunit [Deltaproteobacteria bacterium]
MPRHEVRIAGFGGQGVVLSGIVLGTAAMYDNRFSTQVQSYGPEARGGACKSEVVISDEEISFPMVIGPEFFIALSQEALDKYIGDLPEGKTLIVDEDLVKNIPERKGIRIHRLPMTRVADRKLKNRMFTNIVMIGAVTEFTGLVSREAMREAVKNIVPRATIEKNLAALEAGFTLAEETMEGRTPAAKGGQPG